MPENKLPMATLIDADKKEYYQRLFIAAVAVTKARPPGYREHAWRGASDVASFL